MLWIILGTTAPLFWAISNLIDTDLIDHRIKSPLSILAIAGLFNLIPSVFLFLCTGFPLPGIGCALFAIFVGALSLIALLPYTYALIKTSLVSVVLMWNLYPVFVIALAWLFLHERLISQQYVAIFFLVASAVIASIERSASKTFSFAALLLMLLASLLEAVQTILEKYLYTLGDFWSLFPYVYLGGAIMSLVFFAASTRARFDLKKTLQSKLKYLFVANESIDAVAVWLKSFAVSLGPVSVVNALGSFQPIFITLLSFIPFVNRRIHDRQKISSAKMIQFTSAFILGAIGLFLISIEV